MLQNYKMWMYIPDSNPFGPSHVFYVDRNVNWPKVLPPEWVCCLNFDAGSICGQNFGHPSKQTCGVILIGVCQKMYCYIPAFNGVAFLILTTNAIVIRYESKSLTFHYEGSITYSNRRFWSVPPVSSFLDLNLLENLHISGHSSIQTC